MSGVYTLEDLYINSDDLYMIKEEANGLDDLYAYPENYSVKVRHSYSSNTGTVRGKNVISGLAGTIASTLSVMAVDNNNYNSYDNIASATFGSFWDISQSIGNNDVPL